MTLSFSPRLLRRVIALFLFGFAVRANALAQEAGGQQGQSSEQSKPGDSGEQENTSGDIAAVPNRPTFASTAEMVQLGVFEIEYGLEAADGHQNINGLLKWGAVKNRSEERRVGKECEGR